MLQLWLQVVVDQLEKLMVKVLMKVAMKLDVRVKGQESATRPAWHWAHNRTEVRATGGAGLQGGRGKDSKGVSSAVVAITSMTKLLVGREDRPLPSGFCVQLLMSAPVCLLISLTHAPEGPAIRQDLLMG